MNAGKYRAWQKDLWPSKQTGTVGLAQTIFPTSDCSGRIYGKLDLKPLFDPLLRDITVSSA